MAGWPCACDWTIWIRRNHSMQLSGRKTRLSGNGKANPVENWKPMPAAATVYVMSSSKYDLVWSNGRETPGTLAM